MDLVTHCQGVSKELETNGFGKKILWVREIGCNASHMGVRNFMCKGDRCN